MRTPILLALVLATAACAKPAATPPQPITGACDDGVLLGESAAVPCARGHACRLDEDGPTCVASAEGAEACGMIACGEGCTCSSVEESECMCARLGPPKNTAAKP
jgi:hypothetical protein